MRIERAPDLPEDMAEALGAEGRPLGQFHPPDQAHAGTTALRISPAAFDRILAQLAEFERK